MRTDEIKQAAVLLLEEYPFLAEYAPVIARQFQSADGRRYNTFLVHGTKPGWERFVAKGVVHADYASLTGEWRALAMLQQHGADAPRLLVPEHVPQHFLLIEYIEGVNAADAVVAEQDVEGIFHAIGVALGKLHRIPVAHDEGMLPRPEADWETFIMGKMTDRLQSIRHLLAPDVYANIERYVRRLQPILRREAAEDARLIHRDIYLENFILRANTGQAVLIDYGMAMSGRPFYDLAKLYVVDLYRFPEQHRTVLEAYRAFVPLPPNFAERMRLYILKEALGMAHFFYTTGNAIMMRHAITVLEELTENRGVIARLLR